MPDNIIFPEHTLSGAGTAARLLPECARFGARGVIIHGRSLAQSGRLKSILSAAPGEVAGWERANWFATEGQEREYRYSWKRQNWFDNQRAEHLAVREAAGLFDMTSFGKIDVRGPGALALLDDDDPVVAETAAWAAGERQPPEAGAAERRARLATTHPEHLVREAAVAAIGAIGDPVGLPAVLAALDGRILPPLVPALRANIIVAIFVSEYRIAFRAFW